VTQLRTAATIAFWLHLLAGVSMAVVLRRGLETNPDFQDRLAFIINQRALWTCAWLTWMAAAVAILYFYMTFSSAHQLGGFSVLLATAGFAADLPAQAIEIGVLPGLAGSIASVNAGTDLFVALHRTAVMMSGCIANGLYSVSAFILAWGARRVYPVWVSSSGIATACFGVALSAAALLDSTSGMFWTNVFLVPSILLWLAGVAQWRFISSPERLSRKRCDP
jgi:hypothetical protein